MKNGVVCWAWSGSNGDEPMVVTLALSEPGGQPDSACVRWTAATTGWQVSRYKYCNSLAGWCYFYCLLRPSTARHARTSATRQSLAGLDR
jgi:hypothetical protein